MSPKHRARRKAASATDRKIPSEASDAAGCMTSNTCSVDPPSNKEHVLLADLFSQGKYTLPLELTCEEIAAKAEACGLMVAVHAFTEMRLGENLRDHAQMMQARRLENPVGPWIEV